MLTGALITLAVLSAGLCACRHKWLYGTECQVFRISLNVPEQRAKVLFNRVLAADFVRMIDKSCWRDEKEWCTYSQNINKFKSQTLLFPLSNDSCELSVELYAQMEGMSLPSAMAYVRTVQKIVDETNIKMEADGLAQLRNRVRKLQSKISRSRDDMGVRARLSEAESQLNIARDVMSRNAIAIVDVKGLAVKPDPADE